jgi:isoamylase
LAKRSFPYPLGVTLRNGTANVAVYSASADAVEFCPFDDEGGEHRTPLSDRTGHVFHGLVADVAAGTRYGLRVHGEWNPAAGLRHNPHKLLLDPHATAISGDYARGQAVFGHDMNNPESMDQTNGAGSTPLCVVTADDFEWDDDSPPLTPLSQTVIYETHVKGFTQLQAAVPEQIRGTYAGMGHPAAIKHLTDLGVTAVELIPVQQFVQDSHLLEKGLSNYWGYNTIGFLAPHGAYSSCGDNGGQVNEFKAMVKALHAAGLEVILDVVYNHTAEGNDLARPCRSRESTTRPTTDLWKATRPTTSIRLALGTV